MANEPFTFSIVITDAPDSDPEFDQTVSQFSETFHIETDLAGQILRSAPIQFIGDVTRSEVSDIKDHLIELSEGPLSFRISSADLPPLPEVNWPDSTPPDFDSLDEGQILNGLHIDYHGNAVTCPECGEIMVMKQTGVSLPTADSSGHEQLQAASGSDSDTASSEPESERKVEQVSEPEVEQTPEPEVEEASEPETSAASEDEEGADEDLDLDAEIEELELEQEPSEELDQVEENQELSSEESEIDQTVEELPDFEEEVGEGSDSDIDDDLGALEEEIEEIDEDVAEDSQSDLEDDPEDMLGEIEESKQEQGEEAEIESDEESRCNVFISNADENKKDEMIPLLTSIRNCSESEAEELINRPITPVVNNISEQKAEAIKEQFSDIGVTVNITSK